VYDVLVGPLMKLAAHDATRPLDPHTGNVLGSQPELNRLRGDQVMSLIAIPRNVVIRIGDLAKSTQ
jgi:hypothetical protein